MATRILNSFKVRSGNKILDYRNGENLDLEKVQNFFQKNYQVKKLWKGPRHILGLVKKYQKTYFLKLSTSEGISILTKNEYKWNNYFHKIFPKKFPYLVPKNYDSGLYKEKYYYLVTDYFNGKLLCETRQSYEDVKALDAYIPKIIEFSELIQKLPGGTAGYQERFIKHVKKWFGDIPPDVCKKYNIEILLKIVKDGKTELSPGVRHGDFAPWHIMKLFDDKLGLIDGEHFITNGVEGYDICYFIQRVFSVLQNPNAAKKIYSILMGKKYKASHLKTVLAARAIGGFLDESLKDKPDYKFADKFKNWILEI